MQFSALVVCHSQKKLCFFLSISMKNYYCCITEKYDNVSLW